MKEPLLIILGPTASGKTQLAVQVARAICGEVLSADSRQVYRRMDIGTGKDLDEYNIDGEQVPYHLIDIRDAGEQYNVSEYQEDFAAAYLQVLEHNKVPIVCGGTGFYIHALLKGHAFASIPVNEKLRTTLENEDFESLLKRFNAVNSPYHGLADTSTRKRTIRAIEIADFFENNPDKANLFTSQTPQYHAVVFGLNPEVTLRRNRISKRLKDRLENGMIEEVKDLLDSGLTPSQLIYYGLEYKLITQYLTGETDFEQMKLKLETEIHRFAKRQMTFFRKMEKDGIEINWLDHAKSTSQHVSYIINKYRDFQASQSR